MLVGYSVKMACAFSGKHAKVYRMKTKDAIAKADGASKLAELLGITPAAISQWGKELPQAREWQLRLLRPEWFYQDKAKA